MSARRRAAGFSPGSRCLRGGARAAAARSNSTSRTRPASSPGVVERAVDATGVGGEQPVREERVRDRVPHVEDVVHLRDPGPRSRAAQRLGDARRVLAPQDPRVAGRHPVHRREEPEVAGERLQDRDQAERRVDVALSHQPRHDQQGGCLGDVDLEPAVVENRPQVTHPGLAEGVREDRAAVVIGTCGARQVALERGQRSGRRRPTGGEAPAQHLGGHPRGTAGDRRAGADAQRPRAHAGQDARPLVHALLRPGAGRAVRRRRCGQQRLTPLRERVRVVHLVPFRRGRGRVPVARSEPAWRVLPPRPPGPEPGALLAELHADGATIASDRARRWGFSAGSPVRPTRPGHPARAPSALPTPTRARGPTTTCSWGDARAVGRARVCCGVGIPIPFRFQPAVGRGHDGPEVVIPGRGSHVHMTTSPTDDDLARVGNRVSGADQGGAERVLLQDDDPGPTTPRRTHSGRSAREIGAEAPLPRAGAERARDEASAYPVEHALASCGALSARAAQAAAPRTRRTDQDTAGSSTTSTPSSTRALALAVGSTLVASSLVARQCTSSFA
jgi:hypothetical protein